MDINEITYSINGAVFEVNRVLGPGFLEKVYENALLSELKRRELKAESQVPIKVLYKGAIVGEYFADILVEDKVIVELKTVERIEGIHEGFYSFLLPFLRNCYHESHVSSEEIGMGTVSHLDSSIPAGQHS